MKTSHYQIYLRFLEETSETEFEWGTLALTLAELLIDFPKKMRISQGFNLVNKFAHRTPGWEIATNHKHQKTLRRKS